MNKKWKSFLVLGTASLLVFTNCHWKRSFESRADWVAGKLSSKLDLTKEQEDKLEIMKKEIVAKHLELKPKNDLWMQSLLTQVRADKMDGKNIEKLGNDREASMTEMRKLVQQKLVEFHAILTPEQRKEFAELLEKVSNRFLN